MRKKTKGLTLVEIMTVMAIVALVVSVAIIEGAELKKQANESNVQANLSSIASGFEVYSARHGGVYAQGEENNLAYLVADGCLHQDLITIGRVGNFNYTASSIAPGGYDVRAMAASQALAGHNYQIITGGQILRSDTSSPSDTNFKAFK